MFRLQEVQTDGVIKKLPKKWMQNAHFNHKLKFTYPSLMSTTAALASFMAHRQEKKNAKTSAYDDFINRDLDFRDLLQININNTNPQLSRKERESTGIKHTLETMPDELKFRLERNIKEAEASGSYSFASGSFLLIGAVWAINGSIRAEYNNGTTKIRIAKNHYKQSSKLTQALANHMTENNILNRDLQLRFLGNVVIARVHQELFNDYLNRLLDTDQKIKDMKEKVTRIDQLLKEYDNSRIDQINQIKELSTKEGNLRLNHKNIIRNPKYLESEKISLIEELEELKNFDLETAITNSEDLKSLVSSAVYRTFNDIFLTILKSENIKQHEQNYIKLIKEMNDIEKDDHSIYKKRTY